MWKASTLNLDSTQNLITLRADWRLSYDHGDWAFVPAKHILRKILKYKATSFDKPYPGFDPDELHDYVFVPLPSLRRHYILRLTEFDEDEDEGDDEGENEDRERGGRGAESGDEQEEGEDEQEMVDIEDGNATIYITPFLGFPVLKHHAHPFFVIYNALPKSRNHQLQLRTEHRALLMLMTDIEAIWISRLFKAPSSPKLGKRRRPSNDDDDDDARPKRKTRGAAKRGNPGPELPGTDRTKTRETRGGANVSKGKRKAGETTPAQPQESQHLPPSPTSQTVRALRTGQDFLYDDMSEVAAWAVAVAAAGPPEDMDEAVIWSDKEPVRKPIKNWDRWHVPYKQPKQQAQFCSSDWPMYLYSFPLWLPPFDKW